MKLIPKLLLTATILLCGCSSSSSVSSADKSGESKKETVTVGKFTCQKEIELTEGDSASYKNYCKLSTSEKFSVSPETVDTKKVGNKDVDITLTDDEGNVTFTTITLKVKAKATPTPEPTLTPELEETQEEAKQSTTTQSKQNTSSNKQSTYSAPQQSQAQAQAQPTQAPQQSTETYEIEDVQNTAGSRGAAAGSTFDDQASCMSSGGTANHICTYDAASQKYVLSYQY